MKDLFEGKQLEVAIPDQPHSAIKLVDTMPRLVPYDVSSGDYAVAQAARVSYGEGTRQLSEDRHLIRYLLRHRHTTPFEMIEMKWFMQMPISTARQFIRHRTANVNEYSARYSVVKDMFYVATPENVRKQSNTNKQGGTTPIDPEVARQLLVEEEAHDTASYALYQKRLDAGMAREIARNVLPVNMYTMWFWKNDMWNTMNFLRLRMDSHAQLEIRQLANAMYEVAKQLFPVCLEAFDDYINMNTTVSLSRLDVDRIQRKAFAPEWIAENGKLAREEVEFQEKRAKLGL